jgi:hypothetical protein
MVETNNDNDSDLDDIERTTTKKDNSDDDLSPGI